MKGRLLESITREISNQIPVRRYSLADMISESYRVVYQCEEGTNLKKLAESHLEDVKSNPREIDKLSRQICVLKELQKLTESGEIKDEDLVDKKYYDTVEPKEDRVVVVKKECNESTSITEADDPELTDEELEELTKHLETIRKERKSAPKTEVTESDEPKRRGIRCKMIRDCNAPKKIKEAHTVELYKSHGDDPDRKRFSDYRTAKEFADSQTDNYEEIIITIPAAGGPSTVNSWNKKDGWYRTVESKKMKESKSYKGLTNFKSHSEGKAFYKTFKKMHESLKEGKALTRQESIDLYKAANSALTQMSIELEHNPEFLEAFNESSTLLSKDVNSLRESLSRGKAPSKKTMKSLAKFSGVLLKESNTVEINAEDDYILYVDDGAGFVAPGDTVSLALIKEYWNDNKDADYSLEEYGSFEEWFQDTKENYLKDCEDCDEGILDKFKKKSNAGDAMNDLSKSVKSDADDLRSQMDKFRNLTKKTNESEEEDDEDLDDIEEPVEGEDTTDEEGQIPEEGDFDEFVGDDEGDIDHEPSAEEEEYDQEYADGREELHQELADKYEETEDEFVQDKLETDRVEVAVLNGEDPDEASAEESPEDGEETETAEDDVEDEPEDEEADDSEITDDELAELKSYLKEMRSAKKLKESQEGDLVSQVKQALEDAGIRYSVKGRSGDRLIVAKKDLQKASEIRNSIDPNYTVTVATPV